MLFHPNQNPTFLNRAVTVTLSQRNNSNLHQALPSLRFVYEAAQFLSYFPLLKCFRRWDKQRADDRGRPNEVRPGREVRRKVRNVLGEYRDGWAHPNLVDRARFKNRVLSTTRGSKRS